MDYKYFIGVDIGKAFFEVGVHGSRSQKTLSFANNQAGFKAFCDQHHEQLATAFVVVEATGGYETALLAYLLARQVTVHRATPLQAKHFARSLRLHGKTDRLDALALARYGAERHEELTVYHAPDATQAALLRYLQRRADLIAMRVAEENRLAHPNYAALKGTIKPILTALAKQIAAVEAKMAELIAQSERLSKKLAVLKAVKGVGTQTATVLLAAMPELGTLTRREAASLAGLAPHPRDSGNQHGYRRTCGGRSGVKRALFMATLTACRHNKDLAAFYQRLLQNGKKKMVALVAVMRKLLVILNAKLRDMALPA